ncbi:hypothetical protein NC653_013088 [Populus alba x Populus x berolinensis]|uniref:Uncharacterized protein n=1 Tax=Populus alba x Populus x berolinensis TaxID=444605 RepID=A0AAD6W242_9ROSI|nr:hypothetical protein NC653_013088 [Populus alba x Populus x berolinensis]
MSMIYLGIPEENVLEKHIEGIQRFCGSNAKVNSLASQYVQKLGMIIKRSTHELDLDDQASIKILVAVNSTFGIKGLKVSYAQHALPATWILTRRSAKPDVAKWMKALPGRASSVWSLDGRSAFAAFGGGVDNTSSASEELIHDFVDQTAFIQYFKASWVPKIEMWLSTMRALPLANQEASYRFADESDSFQNVKEKYIESTSWNRALQIPDSFTVDDKDHLFAKISSQKDSNLAQIVSRLSRLR